MGLLAEEIFGINSGWNVSTYLTQAGQQLVNCGSGALPVVMRRINSEPSSRIVKSAENVTSNT